MLAQNFLTAEELQLRPCEYEALIKVLGILERGEITFVPNVIGKVRREHIQVGESNPSARNFVFNMAVWHCHLPCGTVHCIGGLAEEIGGFHFSNYNLAGLDELFHPFNSFMRMTAFNSFVYDDNGERIDPPDWEALTVSQAAMALRSYLNSGHPHWGEAVGLKEKR